MFIGLFCEEFHEALPATAGGPCCLGLLAPVHGPLSRHRRRLGLRPQEQVTSVTQVSDVYPTDWAYQALSNLVEQYGCVAGYPNGTFRGNRAMTRYEAAALLNAASIASPR